MHRKRSEVNERDIYRSVLKKIKLLKSKIHAEREADILRQILDYLAVKHIFAFRLSTGSFFNGKRAFRSHSLGAGAADILALPKWDLPVWIEVKSARGRQRPSQKLFEENVRFWGHRYVVARSIDDLAGFL